MTITIATKNQLPPEMLHQIILFDDSVELLKQLREILKSNQEEQSKLGSKTFGLEPFLRGILPSSLSPAIFKPDVSQMQAMHMAFGSEVTYIVGPPGTGKTVTLAAIALNHLLAGRTVLITAHTNIAVDNAILKLADLSKKADPLSKLSKGAAIRFGVPEHPDLRKPEYEDIYLPAIAKRRSVGLQQTRDKLEVNLKNIESRSHAFAQENKRKRDEWHYKRQQRTAQLDLYKKELTRLQASEEQHITALNAEKRQVEERYKQANQQLYAISQYLAQENAEYVRAQSEYDKLFTHRGITLELSSKGYENSALLEYQSRMHPEISNIARKYVYNQLIKDIQREERGDYSQVLPLPEKHLVLCDTSDASPVAVRPESSRINIYHALCSVDIARYALSTLPEDGTQQGKQRIGIVTPYKKQSKLLQNLINDADLKEHVRVGTVHKFQGLEFDVVIFDTVESPDIRPRIEFIAGGKATEALRLINVAVTRAKHKLIIVANAQHILNAHFNDKSLWFPEGSILRKAVEEARQCLSRTSALDRR